MSTHRTRHDGPAPAGRYFKVVTPAGDDPHHPGLTWPVGGAVVGTPGGPGHPLRVSTTPVAAAGEIAWPFRLLQVSAVGPVEACWSDPRSVTGAAFRVEAELDATGALGPQGRQVADLLEAVASLPDGQRFALGRVPRPARLYRRAWDAVMDALHDSGRVGAGELGRFYPVGQAWGAVEDTVRALVVRDLLDGSCYDLLTGAWRTVIGPVHPDDPALVTERPVAAAALARPA